MSNKEKPEGSEDDLLRMLLTKNWDQVKYLRSMIMWFTELYVGVIVGAVVLLDSTDFKNQSFLLIFFIIVTLLGLVITIRMNSRIEGRVGIGKKVMLKLDLGEYMLSSERIFFTWRHALILFYSIMCIIWIFLLID